MFYVIFNKESQTDMLILSLKDKQMHLGKSKLKKYLWMCVM